MKWVKCGPGEWLSECGVFVVWLQELGPRTDSGRGYAAARVNERYTVNGRAPKWLCDAGTLREAKKACEKT